VGKTFVLFCAVNVQGPDLLHQLLEFVIVLEAETISISPDRFDVSENASKQLLKASSLERKTVSAPGCRQIFLKTTQEIEQCRERNSLSVNAINTSR
jgi:hypothetical protein